MKRVHIIIGVCTVILGSILGLTYSDTFAYGTRPTRYSDLSAGHKELLRDVAQERGYTGFKDSGGLTPETQAAFSEMASAASVEGLTLRNISGYRSYDAQVGTFFNSSSSVTNPIQRVYGENMTAAQRQEVFDDYVARGEASAPPGYSEHHAGIAVDINSVEQSFGNTAEFRWLQANAAEYGFELSYPSGSTSGAGYEPWHWRYIGGEPLSSFETDPSTEESASTSNTSGGTSTGAQESKVSYDSFTNFPGIGRISNLCQLTQALWFLGFAILFLSVIGSILYGGFLYTAAGVNAAQVNQAKEVITNAFVGLILGLSIFIILQTIDPNLLGGNCEIESIEPFSYSSPTLSGAVQDIPSDLSCTESDPSVWKFQGGKSMAGVDERLHAVATEIFRQCSQFGEFQISSTVRNRGGTSFHETGDALDFADGSQIIRDKQTGQCIERVAAACGIPQSRINPGVDANQRYHVHIDLGTRD